MAETTTDNLLNNGNFSNQLNGWTVEDTNKTKYDNNCYAGGTDASGLCKSVRWSGNLGKTIAQSITGLEEGYDIEQINLSFTALGCNNEINSSTWCSQGTDYDKVQATIELSNDVSRETLYLEQQLDYNDGTDNYNLTTQTLDNWVTDNTNLDFSITGIDTGNWSGQYGPIVDNIELTLDLKETVIPEVIVEPIAQTNTEDIIEVEPLNTVMEGINLETSVLNEVVLEIPEIPEVEIIEVAVIEDIPVLDDLPEINETTNVAEPIAEINDLPEIEELPEIEDIEVVEDIAEIEEIEVEEVAEQNDTKEDMEQPEEVAEKDVGQDNTNKNEEKAEKTKTKKDAKKQKKTVTADKNIPKTKKEQNKKADIPVLYTLLTLEEGIKIIETIKIVEVIEYEQDITDYTSNVAWDNWVNTSNNNWGNLDSIRPVYTPPSYRTEK